MANWRRLRPWARVAGGISVGAACLWLSWRGARVDTILHEIAGVAGAWVWLALAGVLAVSAAKALRWQWLYPPSTLPLAWATHFGILMTSQMLNLLIPIRLGEVARLGLMRQEGRPLATTLATIVVEKSLDLLVVQALLLVAVTLAVLPEWLRVRTNLGVLALGLGLPLALAALIRLRGVFSRLIASLPPAERSTGARLLRRLGGLLQTMLDSIAALQGRQLVRLVALTTGIWVASLAVIQMMLIAFGVPADWGAALILMLALTFSNWVPTPPGLLGVVGAIAVAVLGPFGVAPARALALGTVLNGLLVLPPVVLGAWSTWTRLWRLSTFARSGRLVAALGISGRFDTPSADASQEGPPP